MAKQSERDVTSAIAKFNSDRGWIINSFSQIECRLADLIIQCQGIADYEELNQLPLPMGVGSRITRVRELMKSGPLSAHAAPLEKLLSRLEEFEELRHLMTHGYAAFHFTPDGDMGMAFMRFVPPKKGEQYTEERKFYRLDTMHKQRESSLAFVSMAMDELRKIYEAVGLDPDRLAELN